MTVLVLVLGACSSGSAGTASASLESGARPSTDPSSEPSSGELAWSTCRNDVAAMATLGLQCATLEVPLDPARPDGDTIELAVARAESSGPASERIGSLVITAGGPGGSGIEFLASAATAFPDELTDRFDLVSFDPRGVGASTPVRCLDDETKDAQLSGDLTPDTEAEIDRALADQEDFREGCEANAGQLVRHMSTADVAADLDALRAALGDEELTYLGFSYGTEIGAAYATLFPDRSRALVLDGSVSPDASDEEELLAQAKGFERTLANFVAACDADEDCELGPDSMDAIDSARRQLEATPIRVDTESGPRELNADLFDLGLATALYDTSLWGTVARAIADLDDDGASVLLSLVDRQIGRQPDGSYDNSTDAQTMVSCSDTAERPSVEEATEAAARIQAAAPTFGGITAFGTLGCLDWPEATNPLPPVTGAGAAPVLVIGTLGDPATPYEWSQEMSEALESAVLLTYEGDGHTAFLRGGPCIETAVVDYLVDLVLPPEGTRCAAVDDGAGFASIRDELVRQFEEVGYPEDLAACVIDGMIDDVGEQEFERLVLGSDQKELTKLITAQALRCAAGN